MLSFWKGKKIKKADLGVENQFYFNNELKRWVEKGKEAAALEETVPNEPPKIAEPVRQVVQATGIAAKYVDTGFGKPGAVAEEFKSPIFPGPNGIKAPSPEMKFFVPTMPTTPTAVAANNRLLGNDNAIVADQVNTPPADNGLGKIDKSESKIGKDPLLDIFGPDDDDDDRVTEPSSDLVGDVDPLDEIFAPDGPSSPQTDSTKNSPTQPACADDPINSWVGEPGSVPALTTRIDNSTVQTPVVGNQEMPTEVGEDNTLGSFQAQGFTYGGDMSRVQPDSTGTRLLENEDHAQIAGLNGFEPISVWSDTPNTIPSMTMPLEGLMVQGQEVGDGTFPQESANVNARGDLSVLGFVNDHHDLQQDQGIAENTTVPQNIDWDNPDNHADGGVNGALGQNVSQEDPSATDFGWTAEETVLFYQWMDERFGPAYREWNDEDWSNFWQWYNNPVQEDYTVTSSEQMGFTGVETGFISIASDDNVYPAPDSPANRAVEDVVANITGGDDAVAVAEVVDQPILDSFYSEIAQSNPPIDSILPDQACLPEETVPLGFDLLETQGKEGKQAASNQGSEEGTEESPVTAEVRSDTLSKSNGSFSSGSQEIVLQGDLTHLHDFFAQVSDVLELLTPGTDDLAKQQADCQDQMRMLMRSLKEQNGSGSAFDLGCQVAVNSSLQNGHTDKELAKKVEDAEKEADALRLELQACALELTDTKKAMELLRAEHKEAQDHAITNMRTELEQSYHHRLVSLQQEVDSKASEITALQASRVPSSLGEISGQGGDLQKLREALEEMELSHSQEIAELQYELDMKVTESDDIQHELDTLAYKITHGLPLGGELKGLVPNIDSKDKLEAAIAEVEDLKRIISELEESREKFEQRTTQLSGSLDEANMHVACLQEELESVRSVDMQPGILQETGIHPQETLMASLGLADVQIKALSTKLLDANVDVEAVISEALGEFIEHGGRL